MPRPSKAAIRQSANNTLQQAREAAGRELGMPVDDWRVVRLATLTMASEQLQAELALGGRIDFNDLLAVDKQLAELRKELKPAAKPMAVQVTYVHPTTKCPKCSHEFSLDLPDDDDNGSPVQAANAKPLRDDPYVVAKPADPSAPASPPSCTDLVPGAGKMSRPQPKVVELKRPSIHEPVVFGDGTKLNPPLKRLGPREAWQGYPLPTV
jgi:hypothetical protein